MKTLTLEEIGQKCPAAFTTTPHQDRSKRYRFISTLEIIKEMEQKGMFPVRASQTPTLRDGSALHGKHMITFRSREHIANDKGDVVPEAVLLNSHDGSTRYKFMAGLFRLVCLNGLLIAEGSTGQIVTKHIGDFDFQKDIVRSGIKSMEHSLRMVNRVKEFEAKEMNDEAQVKYATEALDIFRGMKVTTIPNPRELLISKRKADEADIKGNRNLWVTYNVVQENMIRGGASYRLNNKERSTKPASSIQKNLYYNLNLWRLTTEFFKG